MVRVSKRQKKGQNNTEVNMSSHEHNQDPDAIDPENITLKPTQGRHELKLSENLSVEQKLEIALNKIKDMTNDISFLINEVDRLKEDIHSIKNELKNKEQLAENITSPSIPLTTPNTRQDNDIKSVTGPFPKYEPINRVVPRPSSKDIVNTIGGKAHSLQFTCNLYVDLIERVLGPAKDSHLDYRAMVKEAILVTKAVVSNIKEQHKIDPDLRWSQIDPTIKLEAYKKLEDATEHLLPLKLCSEFWGAHVLISNFWLKRKKTTKKKSYPTQQQQQQNDDDNPQKKPKAFSIPFLTHP